jgi:hypothetical protein
MPVGPGDADSQAPSIGGPASTTPLPRVDQERRVMDEVEQIVKPAGAFLSRPTVQLDRAPSLRGNGDLAKPG